MCQECAKYLTGVCNEWYEGNCRCRSLCECESCQEIQVGYTPQIDDQADKEADKEAEEEAGVDPDRLRPASETVGYGNEGSRSPTFTGAAAAVSTLDARGAVSIVLKELDDKDRALAEKNREIEMLKQKCDELTMQRDDVQARAERLVKEVKDRFFYCPVTLEEWQDNMLRGVCGHMMSLQAAQGMGANSSNSVLRCPFCREESRFRRVMNLGDLKKAAQMVSLPWPEFADAPEDPDPDSD